MARKSNKKRSTKTVLQDVWKNADWRVVYGELKRGKGRPSQVERLFRYVREKIPYDALAEVRAHFNSDGAQETGVYVAHDSMGTARYVGRGNVFSRLAQHKKSHPHELAYFSFYIVENKQHEREIETLVIRAAGPQLEFNDRKKRVGIQTGNVADYEPGTIFYERQSKRGPRSRK